MKKVSSPRRGTPTARPEQAAPPTDDEMRTEYDFRGGVRGKYAARFATGQPVRVVILAPDVAEAFGSARSVNAALRRVLRERDAKGEPGRQSRRPA